MFIDVHNIGAQRESDVSPMLGANFFFYVGYKN